MNKYKKRSGRHAKGTCRWLLDLDDFRTWKATLPEAANAKSRTLLLTGKPGCGESVLMRTVVEKESRDHLVVHFWFDSPSSSEDLCGSGAGFFRAMLYQLLEKVSQRPNLGIEALMALEKASRATSQKCRAGSSSAGWTPAAPGNPGR